MQKGLLIIFSGPSGVGKGTIIKGIMKNPDLKLTYSISMTTRAPRAGEVDGVNYFFVSKEEFMKQLEAGAFLEHACFVDNYYATPKDYVEKQRALGRNVLLEIETVGAKKVMEVMKDDPRCISIFMVPPSIEELERRIRGRNSESDEVIKKRIAKARQELQETDKYDYVVCNQNIKNTIADVEDIIYDEMDRIEAL